MVLAPKCGKFSVSLFLIVFWARVLYLIWLCKDDVVCWCVGCHFEHILPCHIRVRVDACGCRQARISAGSFYIVCVPLWIPGPYLVFSQGMITGVRGLCNGLGPALYGLIFYLFHVDLNDKNSKTGSHVHGNETHIDESPVIRVSRPTWSHQICELLTEIWRGNVSDRRLCPAHPSCLALSLWSALSWSPSSFPKDRWAPT